MPSSPTAVEPAEPLDDTPDWNTVTEEVSCPRCEYNLRGLPTPRCPECGLDFSWTAIFQAAHNQRDWLFEHQWKKKPVRAFFQTLSRTTRPFSFWREFQLTDRPNLKALAVMIFLVLIWCTFAHSLVAVIDSGLSLLVSSLTPTGVPRMFPGRFGVPNTAFFFGRYSPFAPSFLTLAPAAYFLSVFATLHIFRQTLSRCRIRPIHLMRVAGYAFAPLRYWFIAYFLIYTSRNFDKLLAYWLPAAGVSWIPNLMMTVGGYLWFGLLGLSMVSIPIGLHRYLKLPRGWLLGLSADVIATLVLLNLIFSSRLP
jgi:hypothetical protein